ncbi:MAG: RDD family protein [Verrucomicrobiae bacterium]|nr:RDD family protein [Verrucomicrobiae bacterium]
MKMQTLVVHTPEGISFPLLLAGPIPRFLAWLVDWLCVVMLMQLLSLVVGLTARVSPGVGAFLTFVGYFVISIGYGILLEWFWRGQTLGKRLLRLRVMDAHGLRLHWSQIVIRNLLRAVDSLPLFYLVGGVTCLLTPRAQRLGDLAANTIVARQPKTAQPDLAQLLPGKYNSLREHPHLAARLRQRVAPAEARLALEALLRRSQLEPAARLKVFGELATRFRKLVPYPPETTEGLSDEQYVRNVADILFSSGATRAGNRPAGTEIGRTNPAQRN